MSDTAAFAEGPAPVPTPRWKQREAIRARGGKRLSGATAQKWRSGVEWDGGCVTGHPTLFGSVPAYEFERMPEGGGYPEGFIEKVAPMLGCQNLGAIVHLCSGSIRGRFTFDLRPTSAAAVLADCRELPIRSASCRWAMVDPPYEQDYAEALWGMGKQYPTPAVLLREVARILAPGGRAAFLHHLVPALPAELARAGTYGITTGTGYRIRALTVVERVTVGQLALATADSGPGEPPGTGTTSEGGRDGRDH